MSGKTVFTTPVRMRFRQGDPGGIVFFGEAYGIAHDAYEDFVQHLGFSWREWFANETWAVPIRQSSCEHLSPIWPSKSGAVSISVEAVGTSSFTLNYAIVIDGRTCSQIRLVHVFVDKGSGTKMNLPSDVRDRLQTYQSQSL